MTNPEMYPLISHWACTPELSQGGFPAGNVLDAGAAGGPVEDVAAFVQQTGSMDSHLVVVEADSILEPGALRCAACREVARACAPATGSVPVRTRAPRCIAPRERVQTMWGAHA